MDQNEFRADRGIVVEAPQSQPEAEGNPGLVWELVNSRRAVRRLGAPEHRGGGGANRQEGLPRCGASRGEGTRERKTEPRGRGGAGGGHPGSMCGARGNALFNPRCTSEVAVGTPHLHRWAREMKHPELPLVSGPGKIDAWVSETRQPAGQWVGGMAGPESGQGMAQGVAGLPGQVGPAWQGGWGRQHGGVFWVWGKASALPVAIVSD